MRVAAGTSAERCRGAARRGLLFTMLVMIAAAIVARRIVPLRRRTDGPRLVVLYVACTVKDRYLEPYNAAVDYTPNLAAFARESVVFRRHMTEAAQSGIAFA